MSRPELHVELLAGLIDLGSCLDLEPRSIHSVDLGSWTYLGCWQFPWTPFPLAQVWRWPCTDVPSLGPVLTPLHYELGYLVYKLVSPQLLFSEVHFLLCEKSTSEKDFTFTSYKTLLYEKNNPSSEEPTFSCFLHESLFWMCFLVGRGKLKQVTHEELTNATSSEGRLIWLHLSIVNTWLIQQHPIQSQSRVLCCLAKAKTE